MYALDPDDGTILWTGYVGQDVYARGAAHGIVFATSHNGRAYAFEGATGTQLWVFDPGTGNMPAPTSADGTVLIGDTQGLLSAQDVYTGQLLWDFAAGSKAAIVDDHVFVGSSSGGALQAGWIFDVASEKMDSRGGVGRSIPSEGKMHRTLILLVLAILLHPAPASADGGSSPQKPVWGGLGYTAIGVGAIPVTGVGAPLQAVLGDNGAVGATSWRYGGGGKMLLWGVILGGKGYGIEYNEGSGPGGTARISGGGGGFQLGFAVHHTTEALVYPFLGFSGGGFDLDLENDTDATVTFGNHEIVEGGTATFETGYWAVEAGVGVEWLRMYGGDGGQGGWALGAELGLQLSVVNSAWEGAAGAEVAGIADPRMIGGFLWIHLGGGGFINR